MKTKDLIESIKQRGKVYVLTDTIKKSDHHFKKFDIVETTTYTGWMSEKQFNFLCDLAGDDCRVFPKEGGWVENMNISRAMPNRARSWKIVEKKIIGVDPEIWIELFMDMKYYFSKSNGSDYIINKIREYKPSFIEDGEFSVEGITFYNKILEAANLHKSFGEKITNDNPLNIFNLDVWVEPKIIDGIMIEENLDYILK